MINCQQRPLWKSGLLHGCLLATAVVMAFPFVWMIMTSLKPPADVFIFPPRLLPEQWRWDNYQRLFTTVPMGLFLFNSFKITMLTVVGVLISSSMAAFCLAQLSFPGKKIIFALTLATLMIPYQVTLIPVFIFFQKIGWKDTQYPLWVPAFFGTAFGVFMLRQFFISMPRELYEAALIDGCSIGGIWWRLFLPLSKPAMATLGVFSFMWSWNDLLNPLIYLDSLEKMPLTAGLTYFQQQYSSDWSLLMSGGLLSILPIVIIFFFAQRFFIQGISTTGFK